MCEKVRGVQEGEREGLQWAVVVEGLQKDIGADLSGS